MNNKYKISDYKKYIKEHFKNYNIDFIAYYQHILLNNEHAWLFCNPNKCKKSFDTIGNNLQFLVLNQLIKKYNYKLTCYKQYFSLLDRLDKTNNYKKCYCLHKPFYKKHVA